MKKWFYSLWALMLGAVLAGAEPIQVSALHPLMADLAREVGGDRVKVFDLVGEGGNSHHFEPRPADMKTMRNSALVLASGKGMEPYLERLKSSLGGVTILEVGETLPSLAVDEHGSHKCNGDHAGHQHGTIDPHWWQSIPNMRRAARIVALALAKVDPAGKERFMANNAAYGKRLDTLKSWAKVELGTIPANRRKLVTAHNAFGYFADEFGFEVIAVAGLSKEQDTTPRELADTIAAVKKSGVPAIFPETNSSAKVLKSIASATGTRLASPLIADGNGTGKNAGFEAMIRHNVNSITQALGAP